jgi:hypothetical protein
MELTFRSEHRGIAAEPEAHADPPDALGSEKKQSERIEPLILSLARALPRAKMAFRVFSCHFSGVQSRGDPEHADGEPFLRQLAQRFSSVWNLSQLFPPAQRDIPQLIDR